MLLVCVVSADSEVRLEVAIKKNVERPVKTQIARGLRPELDWRGVCLGKSVFRDLTVANDRGPYADN